ncbi:hypothetical protein [Streptomyces sp. NPDC008121]|uniref:hypothetical protein n=1 Tax=Streptomyces sp. NPDC008121 TaxID=3364809 RepID=UPI0036EC52E8
MTVHDVARRLPDPAVLRDHCRALAMLDAVLSPEWEDRYHSFDARWSATEEMASMRDGQGDEFSLVLSPAGVYLRGFVHAIGSGGRRAVARVPEAFRPYVEEPAFAHPDGEPLVTVCLWRLAGESTWHVGAASLDGPGPSGGGRADTDATDFLFELLVDRSAEAYARWAGEYFELPVDAEAVRQVLALRPLTDALVAALNPRSTLAALADDIAEIGYPRAR